MTNTTNLAERLHFSKVDQTELEEVLQAFFGSAIGKSPREIHYGRLDLKQPALIVKYSANSDSQSMDAGPTLTSGDLEHLEQNIRGHLLERQSDRFSQAVFFAHVPVAGWYRYGDRFLGFRSADRGADIMRGPFWPLCIQQTLEFVSLNVSFLSSDGL